jgi:hypothetical protein
MKTENTTNTTVKTPENAIKSVNHFASPIYQRILLKVSE